MALATLSNLKSYIGLNDSSRDTILGTFLDAAENDVVNYLGYDPESQTYTAEHHYGTGHPWVYTKARPITAVTKFVVNELEWDVDELILRDSWIDTREYVVPIGYDIEITYTAGHSTVPAKIELAVLKIAAMYDRQHGANGNLSISSRTDSAGSSVTYGGETVADVLDSLTEYKRYARIYS